MLGVEAGVDEVRVAMLSMIHPKGAKLNKTSL